MVEKSSWTVSGEEVVAKVKQVIHEGNIRRVRLLHKGRPLIDIPLSVGGPAAVATILAAPVLAAIGAAAALITECTIEVEKEAPEDSSPEEKKE